MTPFEILRNFKELLSGSLPFLLRVGINIGDDAWDDFLERAFEVAVLVPLQKQHGVSVRWTYGTWPSSNDSPAVIATVPGNTSVLVGEAAVRGGAIEVKYTERIMDGPLSFAFREFSNPLVTDPMKATDYVTGEVVGNDQSLKRNTRVCAPFDRCQFSVA